MAYYNVYPLLVAQMAERTFATCLDECVHVVGYCCLNAEVHATRKLS